MGKRHGQCLCGSVSIEIDMAQSDVSTCHCTMCRTWNSGPMHALHVGQDITIKGQEHLGVYKSSEWAERVFCKTCGTHLFYRTLDGQHYVSAGLFKDQGNFELKSQIFIDEKPAYYDFANETTMMTGQEIFDLYAPKDTA